MNFQQRYDDVLEALNNLLTAANLQQFRQRIGPFAAVIDQEHLLFVHFIRQQQLETLLAQLTRVNQTRQNVGYAGQTLGYQQLRTKVVEELVFYTPLNYKNLQNLIKKKQYHSPYWFMLIVGLISSVALVVGQWKVLGKVGGVILGLILAVFLLIIALKWHFYDIDKYVKARIDKGRSFYPLPIGQRLIQCLRD